MLRSQPNELLKLIIIVIIIPFNYLFSWKLSILFTSYKDNTNKKGNKQTKIKQNQDRSKAKDKTTVKYIVESNLNSEL